MVNYMYIVIVLWNLENFKKKLSLKSNDYL